MAEAGRLNGVFLGFANRVRSATRLRLVVDEAGSRWVVERLGDKGSWMTVDALSPDVCLHDAELAAAIEIIGGEEAALIAIKEPPKAITCPECFGYQSAHCDRCDGAGVVPD